MFDYDALMHAHTDPHAHSHHKLRHNITAPIIQHAEPLLPVPEVVRHKSLRKPVSIAGLADKSPRMLAGIALGVHVSLGTLLFWATLDMNLVQAFYLAVVAGTTVGYGDFSPFSDASDNGDMRLKLWIGIFYILLGNIVINTSFSLLVSSVATKQGRDEFASLRSLLLLCIAMAVLISAGSLAMSLLEGLSFLEGAYWAVVTVSTVGFGDIVPTHDTSRLIAAIYILTGVALAGHIFTQVAAIPLDAHQKKLENAVRTQYGDELDEDALWELSSGEEMVALGLSESDEYVTRDEFCLITLIRMGKFDVEELQEVQAAFDKLDIRGNRRLDYHDLREWVPRNRPDIDAAGST